MKRRRKTIVAMSVILAVLIILAVILKMKEDAPAKESNTPESTEEAIAKNAMVFPYELEDGIIVESLFQFTGSNPDNEGQEGENIASLTVKNESGKFVKLADITVELESGEALEFQIKNIPSGSVVTVFEKNNKIFQLTDVCTDVTAETELEKDAGEMMELFQISENETTVVLTNVSGEKLENVVVHCHCALDDMYFGGLTYDYPVESIEAGESVTIDALDCYLGEADVAAISKQ